MIRELFPKYINDGSTFESNLSSKVFLYSDHDIKEKEIKFNDKLFNLDDSEVIDLPGRIEDPLHSAERALYNTYEWPFFNKDICNGFLLCFLDFSSNPYSGVKQLSFRAYRLKEEKILN